MNADQQRIENVVNAISLLKEEGILRFHSENSDTQRGELDVKVTHDGLIDCVVRPAAGLRSGVEVTRYLRCESESANALAREILAGTEQAAGQEVAAD